MPADTSLFHPESQLPTPPAVPRSFRWEIFLLAAGLTFLVFASFAAAIGVWMLPGKVFTDFAVSTKIAAIAGAVALLKIAATGRLVKRRPRVLPGKVHHPRERSCVETRVVCAVLAAADLAVSCSLDRYLYLYHALRDPGVYFLSAIVLLFPAWMFLAAWRRRRKGKFGTAPAEESSIAGDLYPHELPGADGIDLAHGDRLHR